MRFVYVTAEDGQQLAVNPMNVAHVRVASDDDAVVIIAFNDRSQAKLKGTLDGVVEALNEAMKP